MAFAETARQWTRQTDRTGGRMRASATCVGRRDCVGCNGHNGGGGGHDMVTLARCGVMRSAGPSGASRVWPVRSRPVREGTAVPKELGETRRGPVHGYFTAQINLWIRRRR